jgi:glycosyltransferase involved in cell wall biosynthesis
MTRSFESERIAYGLGTPEMRVPIQMNGPANIRSGYGTHFVELVCAMLREGADIRVFPDAAAPPLPAEFLACLLHDWNFNAEVGICMANPMRLARIAHHTIGITTWETTKIPAEEAKSSLKNVDELIVPCKDNIETFAAVAPHLPCRYVEEGVDTAFFCPQERDWNAKPLRFGAYGELSYRKGLDLTVNAWLKLFRDDPSVQLDILTLRRDPWVWSLPEVSSNITVQQSGVLPVKKIREYFYSLHALIHPYRGEGWWRPGTEMMATGGILIAPNLMGPAAFHHPHSGWVIPAEMGPVELWPPYEGKAAAERYGDWVHCEPEDVENTLLSFVNAPYGEKKRKGELAAEVVGHYASWPQAARDTINIFAEAYVAHAGAPV